MAVAAADTVGADTVGADTAAAAAAAAAGVEAGVVGSALVADARSRKGTVAVGCPIKYDFAMQQTASKRTEEEYLHTERLPCVL